MRWKRSKKIRRVNAPVGAAAYLAGQRQALDTAREKIAEFVKLAEAKGIDPAPLVGTIVADMQRIENAVLLAATTPLSPRRAGTSPVDAPAQTRHLYRPILRPAGFATLPRGLKGDYTEIPAFLKGKRDLPVSAHPHGVIATDRALTADEMERFDLAAVDTPADGPGDAPWRSARRNGAREHSLEKGRCPT